MKIFILLASIACTIWASSVDTKLYEDTQKKSYYEEIQKQLDSVEHIKKQPKDVLQEERLYLTRVRDASSQDIQIELYDLKIFYKIKIFNKPGIIVVIIILPFSFICIIMQQ